MRIRSYGALNAEAASEKQSQFGDSRQKRILLEPRKEVWWNEHFGGVDWASLRFAGKGQSGRFKK